jgi:hypothetical protein
MKDNKLDPFYRTRAHGGDRPMGIFFDWCRLPNEEWETLSEIGYANIECRVALLCDLGESPLTWGGDLINYGFRTEITVVDPDTSPPYDAIRHVIGLTTLGNILELSKARAFCAVRILSEEEQPNKKAIKMACALRELTYDHQRRAIVTSYLERKRNGIVIQDASIIPFPP